MNSTIVRAAILALVLSGSSPAFAALVSRDDFLVATAGNLVALCTAAPTDPLYTPARNFCHGFVVGTYRLFAIEEAATKRKAKLFCMPSKAPSRDQTIDAFTQWAASRPNALADTPTDAFVAYLTAQYPCN
jgi:hypothetical protein